MLSMKKHTCNVCGSSDARTHLRDLAGIIYRCKSCGLFYRDRSELKHVSDPTVAVWGEKYLIQREEKEKVQLDDYKKILPVLSSMFSQKQTIMEIGCGTGRFLRLLCNDGWNEVIGVEPSLLYNERAKQEAPLANVIEATLKEAHFANEYFDAIVMLHVIEHLDDPCSELEEIYRILKPSGMLVVETPRFDTIWFKLLRKRERSVIPGHLFFFTTNSLKMLLNKVGFEVHKIDYVGRTLTLDRLLLNIARVTGCRKMLANLSTKYNLNRFVLHINLRDMMRIYAKKID